MIDPQTCTKCHTRNPIGNKFCRECGEPLPVSESPLLQEEAERAQRERTQERVAGLLASAFKKSEAREFDEALKMAEEAAELMPESTSAYALLATLYERTNQNEKAISAMERVIQLNPDSEADRVKLEQLRRGVHIPPMRTGRYYEEDEKPRLAWVPLAAAGGVAAVVFGVLMALVNAKKEPIQVARVPSQPRYAPAYTPPMPATNPALGGGLNPGAGYGVPGPIVTPYPIQKLNPTPTPAPRNVARARTTPSGPGAMRLPLPGEVTNTTVPPVVIDPPPVGQYGGENGFGNGARVPVGPPQAGRVPVGPPGIGSYPQPNPNPGNGEGDSPGSGYIRIQVSPGGASAPNNPPGNPPENDTPPAEPPPANPPPAENEQPLSRARRLQTEGRYNEAIAAYREALRNGMGAGDAYLGIAQSYQRLGDSSSARNAYGDAIRAYETQISAGRSAGIARQGIATCRAALDVLGG